jgi:cobalamin-dependent methionine synthase I
MLEQKKLFALFGDVEGDIGVKLSDSNIMYPGKSVSGIYFSNIK